MIKFIETKKQNYIFVIQIIRVGMRTKTPFSYEDMNMHEPLRVSLYNSITLKNQHMIHLFDKFENMYYRICLLELNLKL